MFRLLKSLFKKKEVEEFNIQDCVEVLEYDNFGHPTKIRYRIPVGNLSKSEAEENIRKLMKDYNSWWPTYLRKERTKKIKRIFYE